METGASVNNLYEGRLQRRPNAKRKQITCFREVVFRHGLLAFMLSLICLASPQMRTSLIWGLERFLCNPLPYFMAALGLMSFFCLWSLIFIHTLDVRQVLWIFYLLGISICEEWVFRLAIPGFLASYFGRFPSVVLCNVVFAAIHYFTLRWKLRWCFLAFFGAMGLSRLMIKGDLMLVICVHWFATFLNTPVPVGGRIIQKAMKT